MDSNYLFLMFAIIPILFFTIPEEPTEVEIIKDNIEIGQFNDMPCLALRDWIRANQDDSSKYNAEEAWFHGDKYCELKMILYE